MDDVFLFIGRAFVTGAVWILAFYAFVLFAAHRNWWAKMELASIIPMIGFGSMFASVTAGGAVLLIW